MGIFGSSEEQTLESNGEVNNNVIVGNPVNIENNLMVALLSIICFIKVVEVIYIAMKSYRRSIKKKYNVGG